MLSGCVGGTAKTVIVDRLAVRVETRYVCSANQCCLLKTSAACTLLRLVMLVLLERRISFIGAPL